MQGIPIESSVETLAGITRATIYIVHQLPLVSNRARLLQAPPHMRTALLLYSERTFAWNSGDSYCRCCSFNLKHCATGNCSTNNNRYLTKTKHMCTHLGYSYPMILPIYGLPTCCSAAKDNGVLFSVSCTY